MQMSVVMVVVQDAFQIGAIQHCHGAPAAPAVTHAGCTLSQIYSTSTIVVTSRYLLGPKRESTHGLVHRRRTVCAGARDLPLHHVYLFTNEWRKMLRFTFSHKRYPSLRNVDRWFDKAVSRVSARGSAVTGGVRAALVARGCVLRRVRSYAATSQTPGLGRTCRTLGYHITTPVALRRIMPRSTPVSIVIIKWKCIKLKTFRFLFCSNLQEL